MRRRLFSLVSLLSLLLCLVTVVLWVRSPWRTDELQCSLPHSNVRQVLFDISSDSGHLYMNLEVRHPAGQRYLPKGYKWYLSSRFRWVSGADHLTWERFLQGNLPFFQPKHFAGLGIIWRWNGPAPGDELTMIGVSDAWTIALFAALPIGRIAVKPIGILRRRHRSRTSRCTMCSYQLTGNTSGVCPECGTPVLVHVGS